MKKNIDYQKVWGNGFHAGLKEATERMRGHEIEYPTAKDVILVWDRGTDHRVRLIPYPDITGLSDNYDMCALACYSHVHDMTFEQRKQMVFIKAMHLIIRDKVNPNAVHRVLSGLAEYRDEFTDDMLLD